jgi:hypothetical protein
MSELEKQRLENTAVLTRGFTAAKIDTEVFWVIPPCCGPVIGYKEIHNKFRENRPAASKVEMGGTHTRTW